MPDVIATVWDFDQTLIPGNMQEPLFKKRGINPSKFWKECNELIKKINEKGVEANPDTYYLNLMLRYAKEGGPLEGLTNKELEETGRGLLFHNGALDLFKRIVELNNEPKYAENDIHFENYIVSTGLKRIIKGSPIYRYTKKIWGAEFSSHDEEQEGPISEIAYSLDNTTKTRALFEISKGIGISSDQIDVNTVMPEKLRRVRFCNMVYVADGPSDVPAFSLINQKKGATLAVYPRGDAEALAKVEKLRSDGRVQMIAEANYEPNSTAHLWIINKLRSQANQVIKDRQETFNKLGRGTPPH